MDSHEVCPEMLLTLVAHALLVSPGTFLHSPEASSMELKTVLSRQVAEKVTVLESKYSPSLPLRSINSTLRC